MIKKPYGLGTNQIQAVINKKYEAPVLTRYGAVVAMTATVSGVAGDMMSELIGKAMAPKM